MLPGGPYSPTGFRVEDSRFFRVQGLWFRVQGLGFIGFKGLRVETDTWLPGHSVRPFKISCVPFGNLAFFGLGFSAGFTLYW